MISLQCCPSYFNTTSTAPNQGQVAYNIQVYWAVIGGVNKLYANWDAIGGGVLSNQPAVLNANAGVTSNVTFTLRNNIGGGTTVTSYQCSWLIGPWGYPPVP